jgi:hypothetical protein
MTVIFLDSPMSDDDRRQKLFGGDLFVYSPTARSLELVAFAREMAEEAFAPHFPPDAQHKLERQEYVDVLAKLKPTFINHPRSKELVAGILADLRVDLAQSYLDVPRLRTMTSEFLNAGLTLQFESHRDTWFSAPFSQINYWIPVYDIAETNAMAFHPRYFAGAVKNSSRDYNYGEWVAYGRAAAAAQVDMETRKQPEAEEEIESSRRPAASCSSPGPNGTRRCRTRPAGPGSPSTSGWSTGWTWRPGRARPMWTRSARAPTSATSCAPPTWSACRPT